jgi:crotonobetainyl-CoA:carnitine CoA-transferase CaiB-like acyl-CoA transferase
MTSVGSTGVFDGIRVLDCTQGIAGPTATMHLADFGAEVLKVESREGDRLRDDPGYLCWNRNKRFTNLDARDYRDLSELRRLLDCADVVVVDWPAAELERVGLDATTLLAERHHLTHAWMPPYSPHGRWAHLPDEPALLAAVSGVADFHRATEDRPVLPVVPILAYAHGALGAAAISAALLSRLRTGRGRSVVITGLHAVAAMQAAVTVSAPGISAPAMQKVGPASLANYAPYQCSDGLWLFLGALTEAFFLGTLDVIDLMDVMVMPGVDGTFANILRPEISAPVLARMQERFAQRNRATWLEALDGAGIPVAPVSTRQEWFDSETVAANDLRVDVNHSRLGKVTLPGVALRLSATPASIRHLPDDSYRGPSEQYWMDGAPTKGPRAGTAGEGRGNLPLKGIRILDASSFVAGTFGPSILAQYGADVIKLEPPTGDPYRAFSGSFAVINQAKRGISLDITTTSGRQTLDALIRKADVFVENLRPASRDRLGLDSESIYTTNPAMIHCSMGAYGKGPLGDKPGFDPLLQARSGLMDAQGGSHGPTMSSMLVHDILAGSLAAVGILAALYHREVSGRGQQVTTSLAHASVMVQAGELTSFAGRPPALSGGRDWSGPSPYRRLYRCRDGWICLWARCVAETVATDRALESPVGEFADRLRSFSVGDALDRLATSGVPAAKVLSRYDVFTDPWLIENDFYHSIPDPDVGAYFGIRSVTDWPGSAQAPMVRSFPIGLDTAEVLAGAGVSPARAEVAPPWSPSPPWRSSSASGTTA